MVYIKGSIGIAKTLCLVELLVSNHRVHMGLENTSGRLCTGHRRTTVVNLATMIMKGQHWLDQLQLNTLVLVEARLIIIRAINSIDNEESFQVRSICRNPTTTIHFIMQTKVEEDQKP
jgi:hypothetical protein